MDPEVRKEYRLKLLLEFKYGTETGTEKFLNLKYGYGFRTRLRTPGYVSSMEKIKNPLFTFILFPPSD